MGGSNGYHYFRNIRNGWAWSQLQDQYIIIYLSVIFVYRFCAHSVRVEVIKGLRRERFIKKGVEALPVGLTVVQERERITTSDLCLKPIGEPEIMTMTGISYIKL